MRLDFLYFVFLFTAQAVLAESQPNELLCGYSKGYARNAAEEKNHTRVEFSDGRKKPILVITGITAQKWSQWNTELGPCYVQQPKLQFTDRKKRNVTIYRFRSGIIVAYSGKAFAMSREMTIQWEIAGGMNGNLGLPTSDNMPIRRTRPNQRA